MLLGKARIGNSRVLFCFVCVCGNSGSWVGGGVHGELGTQVGSHGERGGLC